ncbi:putative ribonuclease H-like domain-containing protein [Senna tora]|uniref:Putative ribonuclease H-like domain-containing protein n=1 Tax=Senna tora TaxID=362788 RepID=A0A834WP34_9FABA|nr:putative ribonuclease H-like domain-containing protein [Senna tora]
MGTWLIGISGFLGHGNAIIAELWGVILGLQTANKTNFSRVMVEMDSLVGINLMNGPFVNDFHLLAPMIFKCKCLASKLLEVRFGHTHSEGNSIADGLAKHGLTSKKDYHLFRRAPPFATLAYRSDLAGISFPKQTGKGDILCAETNGILNDLLLAWNKNMKKIIVELDSLQAINLIKDNTDKEHALSFIINKITNLFDRDWDVRLVHVNRDGNSLANALAFRDHVLDYGLHAFDVPPHSCIEILREHRTKACVPTSPAS